MNRQLNKANTISSKGLEVKVHHKDSLLSLFLELDEDFKGLRENVKKLFNYSRVNQFEVYVGHYHISSLFDDLKVSILNHMFMDNEYIVQPSTEKSSFAEFGAGHALETLTKLHTETVDKYMSVHDEEDYFVHAYRGHVAVKEHLVDEFEKACAEEDDLKKNGQLVLFNQLTKDLEGFNATVEAKNEYIAKCFLKILELRRMEKEAVELIKVNKKLAGVYTDNHNRIEMKNREITTVHNKQLKIVKKKEFEVKLLETYIAPTKKISVLEYMNLRFHRNMKSSLVMKVMDEKSILIYKAYENHLKFEMRKIVDTCGFENKIKYIKKNEEVTLNISEKLLISIMCNVFIYDGKSGSMVRMENDLNEDHTGGAFIYVPYNNSVYSISGINSSLMEVMGLTKSREFHPDARWEEVNEVPSIRAYFSTFLQNDMRIYLMFGYDNLELRYLNSVIRYDVSCPNEGWKELRLKGSLPKLCFSSCVPVSDDELYIVGGHNSDTQEDNTIVYCYDLRNFQIDDSGMRLPMISHDELDEHEDSVNQFNCETCFVPLKPKDESESGFLMAIFDTRNYLHLVNIKNFDYSYISYDHPTSNLHHDSEDEVEQEEMHMENEKFYSATVSKDEV